jgi:hypothetical protein
MKNLKKQIQMMKMKKKLNNPPKPNKKKLNWLTQLLKKDLEKSKKKNFKIFFMKNNQYIKY